MRSYMDPIVGDRVCLVDEGATGTVVEVESDAGRNRVLVHWGVYDSFPIDTWHPRSEIELLR